MATNDERRKITRSLRESWKQTWHGEIVNYRDEFECEPNYCPVCGRKLRKGSE